MDGYIPSPYVKSKAPSSSEIQALMNKAEEEYVTWRQTRKPIHHPNVSQKVNSPLKALVVHSPSKRKKSPITPVRLPILSKDEKLKLELEELRHSPLVRTPLLKTTCSSAVILGISTVRSTRNQSNHPSHSFYQPRFSVIANQIISQKEQEQMPEEGGKRGREGEKRGGEEEEGGGHQGIASLKPFTAPVKNSKKGNLFKDLKIEITERSISTADVCDGSAVIPLQPGISPTTSTGGKLHFPPELEDAIVDYRIVNMDTHDGNKHIQEHLYDFYTRQVFCIHEDTSESSNRERDEGEEDEYKDEEDDEDTLLAEYQQVELLQRQASSTRSLLSTPSSATTPSVKSRSPSSAIFRQSSSKIKHSTSSEFEKLALVSAIAAGYPSNGCLVVDKTTFIPQYEYDAIFEMDWQQSNVDKIICDAVERKRICTILKPVYRVVIWHFHFYAASIGLLRGDPFRIHDKNKFLEALNVVPCADLSKYNITNAPMDRQGVVDFVLNVTRMISETDENIARRRHLIADGIEYSFAMKKMIHEHLLVYAQIQDNNHFRRVFLSRGPHSIDFEMFLQKQKHNTFAVFEEYARIVCNTGSTEEEEEKKMTYMDFLNVLYASKLITNPQEEVRATKNFLSCLRPQMDPKISESKLFSPATCSSLSPEELHVQGHLSMASYENFMEAICRFALFRQEVFICKGSFDVCPRQMTSEKCTCEYEQIAHQLDIQLFYQAVQEVIKSLNRNRLRRSMRYQRVLNLRTNDMMMTSSTSSSLPSLASPSSTRSISPTQSSSCW